MEKIRTKAKKYKLTKEDVDYYVDKSENMIDSIKKTINPSFKVKIFQFIQNHSPLTFGLVTLLNITFLIAKFGLGFNSGLASFLIVVLNLIFYTFSFFEYKTYIKKYNLQFLRSSHIEIDDLISDPKIKNILSRLSAYYFGRGEQIDKEDVQKYRIDLFNFFNKVEQYSISIKDIDFLIEQDNFIKILKSDFDEEEKIETIKKLEKSHQTEEHINKPKISKIDMKLENEAKFHLLEKEVNG